MSGRRDLVIAALASFIFGLSGGAIAAIALFAFLHGRMMPVPPPGGMRFPIHRPAAMEHLLRERLDLDSTQAVRVHEILARSRRHYAAVRESTRVEIERVLTPGQRERWRALEQRFRRFHRPGWESGRGFRD